MKKMLVCALIFYFTVPSARSCYRQIVQAPRPHTRTTTWKGVKAAQKEARPEPSVVGRVLSVDAEQKQLTVEVPGSRHPVVVELTRRAILFVVMDKKFVIRYSSPGHATILKKLSEYLDNGAVVPTEVYSIRRPFAAAPDLPQSGRAIGDIVVLWLQSKDKDKNKTP